MITLKRNEPTYFRVAYPTSVGEFIADGDKLDVTITRPNLDGEIETVTVDLYKKDCFNKSLLLYGAVDLEYGEYLIRCIYDDGKDVFEIFKDNLLILDNSEYSVNEDGTATMYDSTDIIDSGEDGGNGGNGGDGVVEIVIGRG